jgi:uncharacterized protein (TIGR02996 family)
MWTEDRLFLYEILTNRNDDLPRLIFADWLEEQGDQRAELIRVQCELAQLRGQRSGRERLIQREHQLLAENHAVWLQTVELLAPRDVEKPRESEWAPLPDVVISRSRPVRGFIDSVRLPDQIERLEPVLEHRQSLGPLVLCCEVVDQRETACSVQLQQCLPLLRGIPALSIVSSSGDEHCLPSVATAEEAESLVWLQLCGIKATEAGMQALANAPRQRLGWLSFRKAALPTRLIEMLTSGPAFEQLRTLILAQVRITQAAARSLGRAAMPNLRELDLADTQFSNKSLRFLSRSQQLPQLTRLNLAGNELTDDAAGILMDAPLFNQLEWLNLCRNPIGDRTGELLRNHFGDVVHLGTTHSNWGRRA